MPRLFVAIDLPDDIKGALAALGHGLAGVRWLAPDHLHLTIRFIGEVEPRMSTSIREGLAVQGLPPFTLQLLGVGCFPPKGKPRVIWAGVKAETGLFRLQTAVEKELRLLGLAAEERRFTPHITLARPKDTPHQAAAAYLDRHESFKTRPFHVQAFHLYSSLLTPRGAIHTLERTYPLSLEDNHLDT